MGLQSEDRLRHRVSRGYFNFVSGESMTLIVCLKAKDCVVFAADSLTTKKKYGTDEIVEVSSETIKSHDIQNRAVAAGCGMSRIQGRYWSDIIAGFSPEASEGDFLALTRDFREFVNREMTVLGPDPSARQGGNTFLLAGFDGTQGGMVVSEVIRNTIDKQFQAERVISSASSPSYIEFIGDKDKISEYIEVCKSKYVPGMERDEAEEFAIDAIISGISAAKGHGVTSIGGDFVLVATVDQTSVTISRRGTNTSCP